MKSAQRFTAGCSRQVRSAGVGAKRPRSRLRGVVVSLAAVLCLGTSLAFSPEDALAYQHPLFEAARARAELQLQGAQYRLRQVETGLSASVTSGTELGQALGSEGTLGYRVALNLGWKHDRGQILDAQRDVVASEQEMLRVRQLQRDGIREALLAHARLWQAQVEDDLAEAGVTYGRLRVAELERQYALGAISQLDLEQARLELEQAELQLERVALNRRDAQAQATSFGLEGQAEPIMLRFTLPEVRVEDLPEYQQALFSLQHAEGQVEIAPDPLLANLNLGLNAGYEGEDFAAGFSMALKNAVPEAGASVNYQGPVPNRNRWRIGLSAEIPLDPAAWTQTQQLNHVQLDIERVEFEQAERGLAARLRSAQANIEFAERELALVEERLALQGQWLERSAALFEAGGMSELDFLRERSQARAEADLARIWGDYIRVMADYLNLVDGMWELR